MVQLRRQFSNELVVIGVHSGKFSSEQVTENIRQTVMRHGIEHPVVNDADFKIWNAYTVNAWPTLILIDPRGRIVGETSGEILAAEFARDIQDVIDQNRDLIRIEPLDPAQQPPDETERPLRYPARLLIHGETLFIADSGHHRILEIRLDAAGLGGEITRVFGAGDAGLADGVGVEARFSSPHGLGISSRSSGDVLYVADTGNHAVRAIRLDTGAVSTIAGTGEKAHGRMALSTPTATPLRSPWAVTPLEQYLMIAMAGAHQVWVLIDEKQLGPFAGSGQEALVDGPVAEACFNQPSDLAFGMGHLFVADAEASAVRAISLADDPKVMTLVGQGLFAFGDQDGPASEALLQHPTGIDYADRLLYVADTYNHKIKVLDPFGGAVQTVVGSGAPGMQDGAFEDAGLFEPEGVHFHRGKLYIADTNNHLVRVADLGQRTVQTLRLRGYERLAAPAKTRDAAQRLPAVSGAPGRLWVTLDVQLPEGYHRNPEMPAQLVVGAGQNALHYHFGPEDEIVFPVETEPAREIIIELAFYFCQEKNTAACLIHRRSLALPVQVENTAGDHARIPYPLYIQNKNHS